LQIQSAPDIAPLLVHRDVLCHIKGSGKWKNFFSKLIKFT